MSELASLLARFRVHLESERRASPHTVRAYLHDIGELVAFVEKKGRAPLATSIDVLLVRSYLASLFERNDATTSARKLSAVRSFLRFCKREGAVAENVAALVNPPKQKKAYPSS